MPIPSIITIDGPAASGKSTVGLKLAQELGYLFFDTGVMYRAVTWAMLQRNISVTDEKVVTSLAEQIQMNVLPPSASDGRTSDLLVENQDVTWEIRRPEVEANVSAVSAYAGVRRALSAQQRRIGQQGKVVMVGRDIGTVVLPEADLKIYLDASAEERARRRYEELVRLGKPADYEKILAAMRERDRIDSTRQVAPLRAAADAIILNSDDMSINQVLQKVKSWIKKWKRPPTSSQA